MNCVSTRAIPNQEANEANLPNIYPVSESYWEGQRDLPGERNLEHWRALGHCEMSLGLGTGRLKTIHTELPVYSARTPFLVCHSEWSTSAINWRAPGEIVWQLSGAPQRIEDASPSCQISFWRATGLKFGIQAYYPQIYYYDSNFGFFKMLYLSCLKSNRAQIQNLN